VPANSSNSENGGYFTTLFKGIDLPWDFVGVPNGSNTCGTGTNCEVWMQWYQKDDQGMYTQAFNDNGGSQVAGIKQMIFVGNQPGATGDFGYNAVVLNSYLRGAPSFYWHCNPGNYCTPPGEVQNKLSCSYGFQPGAGSGYESSTYYNNFKPGYGYTSPPCVIYTNNWMEYTFHIKMRGTTNAPQSLIELYINGTLVADNTTAQIDWAGITGNPSYPNCNRNDGAAGCGWGQFYLDVQMTNRGAGCKYGGGCTSTGRWFDDVVISRQPIAMGTPGSSTPPPTASVPTAPSNLSLQ
jgi:hypothetical protein